MAVQLLVAQLSLLTMAVGVVYVGARRYRRQLRLGKHEVALQPTDALSMPLTGSLVLVTMYLLIRYLPKTLLNLLVSAYLCVMGIFALGMFIRPYLRPRPLTGLACVAVGAYYFATRSWVANNVLAVAIAVVMLESVPIGSFATSFIMLIGLFAYDIFWVFGTNVMLTVATGIDGPIKVVWPRTLWGSHQSKSLLGLGDIVIPGFFIAQTLVFSRDAVRRGRFYFAIALTAYAAALVNTMVVMVIFAHGQPALLYIVPWLLVTFAVALVYKGDVRAAWAFDALTVFACTRATGATQEGDTRVDTTDTPHKKQRARPRGAGKSDESLLSMLTSMVLELFGLDAASKASHKGRGGNGSGAGGAGAGAGAARARVPRVPAPKRNAKNAKPPPPIAAAAARAMAEDD